MATDSRTWFYTTPEPRPYYIEERVNQTLWKNRLQGIYMTCTQPTAPIKMEGRWHGVPVTFEWQPGKHFVLRLGQEDKEFVGVVRQILMIRPSLSYQDSDGMYVYEWFTSGGEQRYKELQGKNEYQSVRLLKAPTP